MTFTWEEISQARQGGKKPEEIARGGRETLGKGLMENWLPLSWCPRERGLCLCDGIVTVVAAAVT